MARTGKMVVRFSMLVAAMAMCFCVPNAQAQLDVISGGVTTNINNIGYQAVTVDRAAGKGNLVMAARVGGGLDKASIVGGSWTTERTMAYDTDWNVVLNTNTYSALAPYDDGFTFAVQTNASNIGDTTNPGLKRDFQGGDGVWRNQAVLDNSGYTSLSMLPGAGNEGVVFGARAGGGLDRILNPDGAWWRQQEMSTNTYVDIVGSAPNQSLSFVWGVRDDGGLDRIFGAGGWHTQEVRAASGYYAVADYITSSSGNEVFAARAGGLDLIYYSGGWQAMALNANTYTDIVGDPFGAGLYGARAGGGLDKIFLSSGSWVTQSVGAGSYDSIVADLNIAGTVYGINTIPEPTTIMLLGAGSLISVIRRKK